jgi:hypothetical protein
MALVVEKDEASNPVDVSLLGAKAVVQEPDAVADTIEEAPGRLFTLRAGDGHPSHADDDYVPCARRQGVVGGIW